MSENNDAVQKVTVGERGPEIFIVNKEGEVVQGGRTFVEKLTLVISVVILVWLGCQFLSRVPGNIESAINRMKAEGN